MNRPGAIQKSGTLIPVLMVAACLAPRSAQACAACFGQDSGPLAQGMNWGILSLLGIIVSVLAGVAGFFVFLARRSVSHGGVPASSAANSIPGKGSWEVQKPQPQTA